MIRPSLSQKFRGYAAMTCMSDGDAPEGGSNQNPGDIEDEVACVARGACGGESRTDLSFHPLCLVPVIVSYYSETNPAKSGRETWEGETYVFLALPTLTVP